jgi:hypothetical protein
MPGIETAVVALKSKPTRANWERFSKALKTSDIRYYSIKFDRSRVNSREDLRKAHAELYGASERLAYDIPIVIEEGRKIRGATIYLKGLLNLNKQ